VHGALRVTIDTSDVTERIRSFWFALAAVAVVVLLAVAAIGWLIARSVTRPLRELTDTASRFASGDLSVRAAPIDGPPEIVALDDTMTTMARRLDGVLATQRAFVADASHQLRTPLTALRLRLENLQSDLPQDQHSGVVDPSLDREVERAIEETNRLTELVSSLLQLARADEQPAVSTADLGRLVLDRVDTWTAVAEERDVVLVGPEPAPLAPIEVRTVPGAIEQILDNVLDNALLVSPAGAMVGVELSETAEDATLRVVDHGPGLTDADKADATRRFWRGDTSTPGTGLGLAIVEALARASGGVVELTDTPGGGLTVGVTFRKP
jgi:signal transduction histidine kinase